MVRDNVVFRITVDGKQAEQTSTLTRENLIKTYAAQKDSTYEYKLHKLIPGKGYTTHILRMVSGQWLTREAVRDPEWWHWVHIVVPDSLASSTGMLYIGGGERKPDEPGLSQTLRSPLPIPSDSVAPARQPIVVG